MESAATVFIFRLALFVAVVATLYGTKLNRTRIVALESHVCPCEAPLVKASPFDLDEHLPQKGSLADLVRKLQEGGKKGVVR